MRMFTVLLKISVLLKIFKIKSLRKSIIVVNESKGWHPFLSHFAAV